MSGYLRSLASRAAMPGPQLRPIAVPYARAPLSEPATDAFEIDTEAPAASSRVTPPHSPVRQMTVLAVDGGAEHAARPEIAARQEPPSLTEAIRWLTDSPSRLDVPTPASRVEATPASVDRPSPPRVEPVSRSPFVEGSTTQPLRDGSLSLSPSTRPRIEPAVVRPVAARPAPSPRATQPRRQVAASRSRDEAAPDVHIHIGRVELTAVQEPAPAPRRRPAAKPAMPLDEYLQRRDGRSR